MDRSVDAHASSDLVPFAHARSPRARTMKEVEGMGFCYFYNMTNQPITLTVNYQPAAAVIPALPTTAPYTPNISAGYELYNTTQPQPGQIGSTQHTHPH